MTLSETCLNCLYDKQKASTGDEAHLARIREILDNRAPDDTSAYMLYEFNKVYREFFGDLPSYEDIKHRYNELVLSMENEIREKIEGSKDPLVTAVLFARLGNYIDFGAMKSVKPDEFLSLFDSVEATPKDIETIDSFFRQCEKAKTFLLVADNCGEIVLDKIFLEELKKRFPHLEITVMVRGGEVLNDATVSDVEYVGMDKIAKIVSNGEPIPGTVYKTLPKEARAVLDNSDVILAKGQGNYESMCEQGRHVFYSFLCKCDFFTERFRVPPLTGMFIEEVVIGDGSL